MMWKSIVLSLAVFSWSSLCLGQGNEVKITGYIVDYETYKPVPFATTILYEVVDSQLIELRTYFTDHSAKYEYLLEPGKRYRILGNAPEYLANEITVKSEKANVKLWRNISIELEPFERNRDTIIYPWIPLILNVKDSESKEDIPTPEILIHVMIDSQYHRQFKSYYFWEGAEHFIRKPQLVQGMDYKAEINAPTYESLIIYFQAPKYIEEEEITVYLRRMK